MVRQQNPIEANLLDRRLASITRWTKYRPSQPKSVAEHCYYVARIARGICRLLESEKFRGKGKRLTIDVLKVIDMALIHDEHEIESGDIPHTITSDDTVNQALLAMGESFMNDMYMLIPDGDYLITLWREYNTRSSEDSLEKQIVKVADTLAGYAEAQEEISRGNDIFIGLLKNYGAILGRFDYEWFKPLKDALTFRGV